MTRFAALTGTRSRPAIELYFDYDDTHRTTGVLLREWVSALPGRRWDDLHQRWVVTDFGDAEAEAVLDAAGFVVVGPRDEPTSLHGYLFSDAERPSTPVTGVRPGNATALTAQLNTAPLDCGGVLDGLRELPVTALSSVNGRSARAMAEFGIASVYDLIHLIPRRYIDLSNPQSVIGADPGDKIAVLGKVTSVKAALNARAASRVNVRDHFGTVLSCRFFNSEWMLRRFAATQDVILHGKVETWLRPDGETAYGMTNPLIDIVAEDAVPGNGAAGNGMLPIYPQSAKSDLDTWTLRRATTEAVQRLGDLADPIGSLARRRSLLARRRSLVAVHCPVDPADAKAGRDRLAYDELLRMQLGLLLSRQADDALGGIEHDPSGVLTHQLLASLPFPLTGAQQRAITEIIADLGIDRPMHRLLQGDVASGKAQPLNSLVLTPSGYKKMGDIHLGDDVVNPTGHITTVTGVFPQGVRPVFKLNLSDGTSVRADGEHIWSVRTSVMRHKDRAPKNMTTNEIAADLCEKNGAHKWHIDIAEPIDLDGGEERPIDPYLLGALLGDGSIKYNGATVTTGDPEMIELISETLPVGTCIKVSENPDRPGVLIVRINSVLVGDVVGPVNIDDVDQITSLYKHGHPISKIASAASVASHVVTRHVVTRVLEDASVPRRPNGRRNPVIESLKSIGLMGNGSADKFIPTAYLNAPIKDRHAMLQGLLDTNGTLDYRSGYNVTFSTTSPELAEGVAWLVRSLGGLSSVIERHRSSGESIHVRITLPAEFEPFRLERKAMWVHKRSKYAYPSRAIISIEEDGQEPVQCIMVNHPNHLYVADNFTVTHNTLVCAAALLACVESNHQAVLMAPTEILASQHYAELSERLGGVMKDDGTPVIVELLTNKVLGRQKKKIIAGLAEGSIDIAVGTHSLLSPTVTLHGLGLVVVDEQHRFGVEQRAMLRSKGPGGRLPDMLIATATPIPRTAVLTVFGDLDTSILDEMPPGRTPVVTTTVRSDDAAPSNRQADPWRLVRAETEQGRQAFVVCPLIGDSETKTAAAAETTADALRDGALSGLRIAVVHGKQKTDERAAIMARFTQGDLDVLVATTVIEVGVDIPNATVMVVISAERFGLAQLHQLRGRVGRGTHPGHCVLVADPRTADAQQRIAALCRTNDGFELSDIDLEIRGWGTLLGSAQSGAAHDLRVANLLKDTELIHWARADARQLIAADPGLDRHRALMDEVSHAVGEPNATWLSSA